MILKERFYKLIDEISNESELEFYYNLIVNINDSKGSFELLTDEQKSELEKSYQESFEESNLIVNEDVKSKYE